MKHMSKGVQGVARHPCLALASVATSAARLSQGRVEAWRRTLKGGRNGSVTFSTSTTDSCLWSQLCPDDLRLFQRGTDRAILMTCGVDIETLWVTLCDVHLAFPFVLYSAHCRLWYYWSLTETRCQMTGKMLVLFNFEMLCGSTAVRQPGNPPAILMNRMCPHLSTNGAEISRLKAWMVLQCSCLSND